MDLSEFDLNSSKASEPGWFFLISRTKKSGASARALRKQVHWLPLTLREFDFRFLFWEINDSIDFRQMSWPPSRTYSFKTSYFSNWKGELAHRAKHGLLSSNYSYFGILPIGSPMQTKTMSERKMTFCQPVCVTDISRLNFATSVS